MQTLKMDFQSQSTPPVVPVMQSDAQSRFIGIALYNGGAPYEAPKGASYTVQYRGPGSNNMGWYDTITLSSGTRTAVTVSKNVVTLELAEQALRVNGNVFVNLCVVTNTGYMLKTFPILCRVTGAAFPDTVAVQSFFYVTGITSEQWLAYVTACQDAQKRAEDAAATFQTDPTLSLSGKAADAAKVGEAVGRVKEDLGETNNEIWLDSYTIPVTRFESGGLGPSGETVDARRCRSSLFSCTKEIALLIPSGYKVSVFEYDREKFYVTNTPFFTETTKIDGKSQRLYRVMIANTADSTISVNECMAVNIVVTNKNLQIQIDAIEYNLNKTVYVSTNGSDGNDGSVNAPFATISHALSVANIIMIKPGRYTEDNIVVEDRKNIVISVYGSGSVYIDNSELLSLESDGNLLKQQKITNGSQILNTVFVKKTTPLEDTSSPRSKGYNVTIWENDQKLTPYLTLDEVSANNGSFTYDGTYIWINPTDGVVNAKYRLVQTWSNCIKIKNCNSVKLVDIHCQYVRSTVCAIESCKDIDIDGCSFSYSNIGEGLGLTNCSGVIRNTNCDYNRNDGLNIHGTGTTNFYDCSAYHNFDDGISHHDGSNGIIRGGKYSHNQKGGIASPTHGASIDVYDAESYANGYGLYAVSDDGEAVATFNVFGSVFHDNTQKDIFVDRYKANLYRSKYTTSAASNGGALIVLD